MATIWTLAVVSSVRAGDNPNGPVEYPREWGANLCVGENGTKVVETSSTATAPEALIDGYANEGHQWEPSWSRGLPASFTLKLARTERINKLAFTTHSGGDGWPRDVEVWVGRTLAELHCERQLALPQKPIQVADFEPVEALFVKVVIKTTYRDEETEIGEIALFYNGASPPKSSDTRDVVELKGGDKLLGDLVDEKWTLRTRIGDVPVARADLVGIALSDDGDRVFFRTGEILAGELALPAVKLRLDTGQVVELARSKVGSFAPRKGPMEFPTRTDELVARGAVFSVGDGERWIGKLSQASLTFQTPFGQVVLPPDAIQSIDVGQGSEPLDRVLLRNGDLVRGLLVHDELPIALALGPEIKLAKTLVTRVAFSAELDPAIPRAPENQRFVLKTGDTVSATIPGDKIKLRTSYAVIELELEQLDRLETSDRGKLKAVLRDGSSIVGRPVPEILEVALDAGGRARIPVDRIQLVENWRLAPDLAAKVDALVKKLDDGTWAAREAAKTDLAKLGKVVIPAVTRALRDGSPEAKKNAAEVLATVKEGSSPAPRPVEGDR